MTNEERLKAAQFERTKHPRFMWKRDGKHLTEDEALVVVLTAERDAAIARAERAEADRDYLAGYQADLACIDKCLNDIDAPHDREDGVSLATRRIRLLGALVHTLTARAEAAEALAASIAQLVGEVESEDIDVFEFFDAVEKATDALRAHAAKVSR